VRDNHCTDVRVGTEEKRTAPTTLNFRRTPYISLNVPAWSHHDRIKEARASQKSEKEMEKKVK